jgi:hypothetical protein
MKRSSLVVSTIGLAGLLASCAPDIPQNPKANLVVMEFDPAAIPPVVPAPNDLAIDPTTGLVNVPPGPNDSAAQIEFNRTYLNTLNGFPMESVASAPTSGDLNPASLATGVLVLDITNPAAPAPVAATPSYTAGSNVLTIPPPGGAWTRAHEYVVVVIGGSQAGAVQGAQTGQQVTGSATWGLVAGTVPVCSLPDGGPGTPGSGCLPSTDLICTASGTTGSACAAAAAQLQQVQSAYAPLLTALSEAPFNIPRSNVAILWTFRITSQAEVAFNPDPASPVIPFPNEILRTQPNGPVNLPPLPPGTPPPLMQLVAGLNTLDGFSTTATIQSAVSFDFAGPGASALVQGLIDPATVTPPLAIGFTEVGGSGASQGSPQVGFCLSNVAPGCPQVSATLLDGGAKPQVLGIVPLTPLNEKTTYAAYMTNAIRDTTGAAVIPSAIFAMVRLVQPIALNDATSCPAPAPPCKSALSLLTDAQAAQLYQLQQGLAPLFAQLSLGGIPRTNVVQAWAFTTETTISALQQLAAAPYATNDAGVPLLPSVPLWAEDVTAAVRPQLTAAGINTASIATIWTGNIFDPFALTSDAGTFNPGLAGVQPIPIPFIMTVPTGVAPAAGFHVTMFGHGLTGNKTNAYAIANALASAGQVMVAIDEVWHGDRNTCTGFGAFRDQVGGGGPLPDGGFPDSAACTNPAAQGCNAVGRCQNNDRTTAAACAFGALTANQTCLNVNQGECAPDSKCEGTGAGFNAATSGWKLINLSNPFASRDNLRQQVIDNSQFARVVSSTSTGNLAQVTGIPLDATKIHYSGQSLGGILGGLYAPVAFNVHNVGLNVPGGDIVDIILTSPAFAQLKTGFQAGLAANGVETNSPVYDLVIDVYQWVLDPADPVNTAYFLTHPTGTPAFPGTPVPSIPADRRAFIQWIVDDQVVPNPNTRAMIEAALHDPTADGLKIPAAAGRPFGYQFNGTSTPFSFNTTTIQTCVRHPFLLAPPPSNACSGAPGAEGVALTTNAQTQIVGFLAGGAPY